MSSYTRFDTLCTVGPNLGSYWLQRLSADNKDVTGK